MKNSVQRHPSSAVTPIETIHGYPSALRIFKIGCSPYWYSRAWLHGKFRKVSWKIDHKPLAIQRTKYFINDINGLDENNGKCGKVGVLIDYENSRACDENFVSYSHSQSQFRNDLYCSAVSAAMTLLNQALNSRWINSNEKIRSTARCVYTDSRLLLTN